VIALELDLLMELRGEVLARYLMGMAVGIDAKSRDEHRYSVDPVAQALLAAHDEIMRLSQVRTLEAAKIEVEMNAILAEQESHRKDHANRVVGKTLL
jgi:hypothetical protein